LADSSYKLLVDQIRSAHLEGLFFEIMHDSIRAVNGGEIRFMGIMTNPSKIKSFEGVDICWVAEAAKISLEAMKILVPTIRKEGSEIWIEFNPDEASDYIYQTFVLAKVKPRNSIVVKINYTDIPESWISSAIWDEINHDKETDYDKYLHVWLGYPRVVLEGAIYAEEMRRVYNENRITSVPYNSLYPVYTFWDLGWQDHTAIWFVQKIGQSYHIIDYYQNRMKPIRHYLSVLQDRMYVYGNHWLPHDAEQQDLRTGLSISQIMRKAGLKVRIVPKISVNAGINAAREVFPLCMFDEANTKEGLKALSNYAWNIGNRAGSKPIHDETSHGADGFRYFAVAIERAIAVAANLSEDPKDGLEALRAPAPRSNFNSPGNGWMR
jgi:phage terminase large subunit